MIKANEARKIVEVVKTKEAEEKKNGIRQYAETLLSGITEDSLNTCISNAAQRGEKHCFILKKITKIPGNLAGTNEMALFSEGDKHSDFYDALMETDIVKALENAGYSVDFTYNSASSINMNIDWSIVRDETGKAENTEDTDENGKQYENVNNENGIEYTSDADACQLLGI